MDKPKTEKLIFCGRQYESSASEALLFKRKPLDQGYVVIVFPCIHSVLPNNGSKFEVVYRMDIDGIYRGTKMKPLDQGAYD